jgi:basic membrane protein A
MGAPTACEAAGVPNVSYNGSTVQACPNTFIVSSRIDWAPYFKYAMQSTIDGTKIDYDWVGTIDTGSVVLTEVNEAAAAPGTVDAIEAAKADLVAGNIHVFDTANFTVGGQTLTSYQADVDDMGDFQPETEVIENGIFMESYYRSAPYFDIDIDGITILGDVQ